MTREQWLEQAIEILKKEVFEPLDYKFTPIKVSVGFTSTKKAIGQHWPPSTSKDGKHASIFIHPGHGDSLEVLGTLVHELCHNACHSIDPKHGHGPIFKKCALAVGLEGKMRSAGPGAELNKWLEKHVIKKLGQLPHPALKHGAQGPTKKQTTRMIKMQCPDCEYIARASLTAIMNSGPVLCPCNQEPMVPEFPEK